MKHDRAGARPVLLVLASTYPRWKGDPEPGFVHELARRLTGTFDVIALVPHAPGALPRETLDGVEVIRYRYAPARLERLVNDGGIVTNLRNRPWKLLLVPGFVLGQAWHVWRLVRRRRVDAVHAHWLLPQGLIAALLGRPRGGRTRLLVTSHGADLFALKGRLLNALKRFVVGRATAVTVVSQAMADELARIGAQVHKVRIQPMGVDLQERFTPDPTVARSSRQLLFVGRLVEKKGLRHLLDAMPGILASQPEASLLVAGFGPEEPALKRQAEALGLSRQVTFLGAVPQARLPDLYRRAAALVAPFVEAKGGDQEGLGLVMVEALGCGCPVVTTRLPAIREAFGGEWPAYCADPGSPPSIAREVVRLMADHDLALAETRAMATHLKDHFDWAAVAGAYARALLPTAGELQ